MRSAHELLRQHGFDQVATLDENHRYGTLLVERNGRQFFAKVAIGDHGRELENELWFCLTLNRAAEMTSDLVVRAPRIEAYGTGWFVCESLVGAPTIVPLDAQSVAGVAGVAGRLARILVDLDRAFADTPVEKPSIEASDTAPVTDLLRRVDRWSERPIQAGTLSAERLQLAKERIAERALSLRPRLQHGDFVPWHIYRTGENAYVLVDSEHASLLKPRFYDLAYLYSRLWTRLHAPEAARAVVRSFLTESSVERSGFLAAFLPILTQRSIGMHADALADAGHNDYLREAQDLLARCLADDVEGLT